MLLIIFKVLLFLFYFFLNVKRNAQKKRNPKRLESIYSYSEAVKRKNRLDSKDIFFFKKKIRRESVRQKVKKKETATIVKLMNEKHK